MVRSEMAGGSDVHNLIAGELYSMLVGHLRGSRCLPFFGDLRFGRLEQFIIIRMWSYRGRKNQKIHIFAIGLC